MYIMQLRISKQPCWTRKISIIQNESVRGSCQHKKELRATEIVQPAWISIHEFESMGKWNKNEIGHGEKKKKGQKRERKKLDEKNSEGKRRENFIAGGKKSRTEREKKTNLNGV